MMNIQSGAKVTLFRIEDKGKWVKASMSESRKNKDGEWENINWNGMFLSSAADTIRNCGDKTRISITSGIVENTYDKQSKKGYTNVKVFECEVLEGEIKTGETQTNMPDEVSDDDLPF